MQVSLSHGPIVGAYIGGVVSGCVGMLVIIGVVIGIAKLKGSNHSKIKEDK